jgi:5-methylcytosine-specific restriction endonuclease McrA
MPKKETGLGWSHQKRRAYLLRTLVDGTPCQHCMQPMYKTQALDADHSIPRSQGGTQADRLLHMSCNRSRGDGTRTIQQEPVLTSRTW